MKTLKQYVADYYEEFYEVMIDKEKLYVLLQDLVSYDKPVSDKGEDISFENFSVLSMTDDKIVACAGGDWQTPIKFEITLVNDSIKTKIIGNTFEEGMDDIIFLSELFGIINSVYDDWYYLAKNLFED